LGEKSAENIIEGVRRSLEVPFARVLYALGIRFVGETTAKYLAAHFRSLDAVAAASPEELAQAEEVGGKIATSIREYFDNPENRATVERLRAAGLQFEAAETARISDALAGKHIVISGTFAGHSRDELKNLIELHGGRNQAAVAANTDYLLAGDKIGPAKLAKATKLGISIINEAQFLRMTGMGGEDGSGEDGSGGGGENDENNDSKKSGESSGNGGAADGKSPGADNKIPSQGTLFG
jgi:DNA ligase (NAD+)